MKIYVWGIKMETCSPTNFLSQQDDIFLTVTGNKFIVRVFGFSGSTGIFTVIIGVLLLKVIKTETLKVK